MERETRMQKYQNLRDEIKKMNDSEIADSPYQIDEEKVKNEKNKSNTSTSTRAISLDDILKAHDEYTSTVSPEEDEEKRKRQAMIEKQERKRNITLFVILGIAVLVFLILLIYFIAN